jgi:hypothetical protein
METQGERHCPGMKAKDLNSKKGNVETQWNFPRTQPSPEQIREIQARCVEIATRFIFQNFCNKSSGGPIGARVTMAAAQLVMSDWGEKWRIILEKAAVKVPQLDGYLDDVQQGSTSLRYGMRWNNDKEEFTLTEVDKKEDKRLKYEMVQNQEEERG